MKDENEKPLPHDVAVKRLLDGAEPICLENNSLIYNKQAKGSREVENVVEINYDIVLPSGRIVQDLSSEQAARQEHHLIRRESTKKRWEKDVIFNIRIVADKRTLQRL